MPIILGPEFILACPACHKPFTRQDQIEMLRRNSLKNNGMIESYADEKGHQGYYLDCLFCGKKEKLVRFVPYTEADGAYWAWLVAEIKG